MDLKLSKKTSKFTSDEYFHVFGVLILNDKLGEFKNKFGKYNKTKASHDISLTIDDLSILKQVYDSHKNQTGLTLRMSSKINMLFEMIKNDVAWETKNKDIVNQYKTVAQKTFEVEMNELKKM